MLDLIYVNGIIALFDILVVILFYLNRVGISHPIQTFSYALKFKLEFVELNQLMAVAARGLQRESFEERRYHHSSAHDAFSAECRQLEEKKPNDSQKEHTDNNDDAPQESTSVESSQLTMPEPVLSRSSQPLRLSSADSALHGYSNIDEDVLPAERKFRPENFLDDDSTSSKTEETQAFSGETLRSRENPRTRNPGPDISSRHPRDAKSTSFRSMRDPLGHNVSQDAGNRRQPRRANIRRHIVRRKRDNEVEDEEEEIGLHMWENNRKLKLETPWFKSKVEG